MTTTQPTADTRQALAAAVRERLWRYLSGRADRISLTPVVEDLFKLPRGETRRLAATHLALSPATAEMLSAAERLLRELPSSIARTESESEGAIRPPIAWQSTLLERRRSGRRTAIVTRPPERRYDTSLARLLKLALTQCAQLGEIAALGTDGELALTIEARSQRARRLLRHVKLEHVRLAKAVPVSAARLAARHSATAVPDFSWRYADAIENQALTAIREVVSEQLLAPTETDRLFELYVGFELLDGLVEIGFHETRLTLIPGRRIPFALLHRDDFDLEIWWQTPIWRFFPELRDTSAYRQALEEAGLNHAPLRPDFVVIDRSRTNALIVEVKFSSIDDYSPDRRGIQDALLYLRDALAIVEELPLPHALVAAWNSTATPKPHRIMVCDQETVRDGIQLAIGSWRSFSTAVGKG